jgi:hypothetical protein
MTKKENFVFKLLVMVIFEGLEIRDMEAIGYSGRKAKCYIGFKND